MDHKYVTTNVPCEINIDRSMTEGDEEEVSIEVSDAELLKMPLGLTKKERERYIKKIEIEKKLRIEEAAKDKK